MELTDLSTDLIDFFSDLCYVCFDLRNFLQDQNVADQYADSHDTAGGADKVFHRNINRIGLNTNRAPANSNAMSVLLRPAAFISLIASNIFRSCLLTYAAIIPSISLAVNLF